MTNLAALKNTAQPAARNTAQPTAHSRPAFPQPLHVGRPNIGNAADIHRRIQEVLDRKWLSNGGVLVREFERRIAELVGVKHCLAVCNATVGLEIAYRAAGIAGEVIVPANTFVATVHALEWQRITPVFCDIDEQTHNLDPAEVARLITPRTAAIVGVHLWGRPCAPSELEQIAAAHGIPLLFDAAHALGCSHNGKMLGRFGLAEVFSFHATKFVNCGEGGAIVTNDDEFAARADRLRNFGFHGADHVLCEGTNGKLSEFAAAVALASLESMDRFVDANQRNHAAYREALADIPGVQLIRYDESERNNYQYVVCEVDEERSPLSRDQWLQVLHAENVLARRYFYPGVHRMEPYARRDPSAGQRLPHTEALLRRVLVLPSGTSVGPAEIELIGRIFRKAAERATHEKSRWPVTLPLPTPAIAATGSLGLTHSPKVSVLMVTYNQEPFIAQAVASVLEQQTSFPIEIIVGEDCSTDRTRDILGELSAQHPGRLQLLLQPQNTGGHANLAAVLARCRGQYVAMLEGDDYWTDPHKLQRQILALDSHPDWAICFHPVRRVFDDGSPPQLYPRDWTKPVATIEDLFRANFMATCSVVFRRGLFGELPTWHREASPGDWALHLLSAAHGDIGCLPEVMADYRVHAQGIWSGRPRAERLRDTLLMFSHVDHHFHGRFRRQIDAYRVELIEALLADSAAVRNPHVETKRRRPRQRTLIQEFSRRFMRPVERTVRLWRGVSGRDSKAA